MNYEKSIMWREIKLTNHSIELELEKWAIETAFICHAELSIAASQFKALLA